LPNVITFAGFVSASHFSRVLKRNCSMSPAALAAVFGALAAVVLVISIGFAIAGAWLILPFAGLEIGLLAAAYLAYARHAADYERIELDAGRLTIEVGEGSGTRRVEMQARGARLSIEKERVLLRGAGEELEIGRHLDAETRTRFAAELQKNLIAGN
jgi:uncharacterized membrane protein